MCGRFSLSKPVEAVAGHFSVKSETPLLPRYNIAPSQMIAVIQKQPGGPERQLSMMRWGLIPRWGKDSRIGFKLINARAETLTEKPAFRPAYRQRRCLIAADGFYEWRHEGRQKQPYLFQMKEGGIFAFAGIWEQWQSPTGEDVLSCSIITTAANDLVHQVHERMPVIIEPGNYDFWLDPAQNADALKPLLQPFSPDQMTAWPVGARVNSPRNDDPDCMKKIDF